VEKYYVASLTAKNTILAGSCVYDHVAWDSCHHQVCYSVSSPALNIHSFRSIICEILLPLTCYGVDDACGGRLAQGIPSEQCCYDVRYAWGLSDHSSVSQTYSFADIFWLRKITTDHHASIVSGWTVSKIKYLYLGTDFL
jgi:hypothetical protein